MRTVGIRNLKNRLSEYVKIASSGETVLVTERDRVVAELTAPSRGRAPELQDALLAEAVRQGWLRPPLKRGGALPKRRPITKTKILLDELTKDRADR